MSYSLLCLPNSLREGRFGQVKRREVRLGLVSGLVSSLEQYFRGKSIFFVFSAAEPSAVEAPHKAEREERGGR